MTTLDTIRTPIDDYLDRQADLTAVERFSLHHDRGTGPLHERWYRTLLPAEAPGPGQQYRFDVDMDACTSCKSCVTACQSLNGLDEGEAWRSVGVVIGTGPSGPTQQAVTTACHHCVEPACLEGCPVDAYDKDPVTGIVRHLDDQCIGCSYCTWTCPYEIPKFNRRLGIVRKCDMCADRLAEGEAPACVQACPNGAIRIDVADVDALRAEAGAEAASLVPGAPASSLTVPSTAYRRRLPLPADAVAADEWLETPREAHRPLILMLVLTQLSVGTFLAMAGLDVLAHPDDATVRAGSVAAALAGLVAIGASVGHLGRPLQAWRAVLGFRHSWLSREIVAFGVFAPLAVLASAIRLAAPASAAATAAAVVVAGAGLAAVACSVLIYATTGRRFWRLDRTMLAFGQTTVSGGVATALVVVAATGGMQDQLVRPLAASAIVAGLVGIASHLHLRRTGHSDPHLRRSARLATGPLRSMSNARLAWTGLGGVVLPAILCTLANAPDNVPAIRALSVLAWLAVVAGELAGRTLFFRAMTAPRMPGLPR